MLGRRCDASHYPYNSSPCRISKSTVYENRSLRLVVQDASLSRWRQGFEPPRERHFIINFNKITSLLPAGHDHQLGDIDVGGLLQRKNNRGRDVLRIQYGVGAGIKFRRFIAITPAP